MATMPTFDQGKLIGPDEWNAHANQINANTDGLTAGATRITTLETNQGTRGTNGTLYSEVETLKTNQGTRGTKGAVYTEIDALRAEVYGAATSTVRPKCKLKITANQALTWSTDTFVNWTSELSDTHNFHAGSNNYVTVPYTGSYLVVASINLAFTSGVTGGALGLKLIRNSTDPGPGANGGVNCVATATSPFNSAGEGPVASILATLDLTSADTLRLSCWHNFSTSGGNVAPAIIPGGFNGTGTTFSITYLGK